MTKSFGVVVREGGLSSVLYASAPGVATVGASEEDRPEGHVVVTLTEAFDPTQDFVLRQVNGRELQLLAGTMPKEGEVGVYMIAGGAKGAGLQSVEVTGAINDLRPHYGAAPSVAPPVAEGQFVFTSPNFDLAGHDNDPEAGVRRRLNPGERADYEDGLLEVPLRQISGTTLALDASQIDCGSNGSD